MMSLQKVEQYADPLADDQVKEGMGRNSGIETKNFRSGSSHKVEMEEPGQSWGSVIRC